MPFGCLKGALCSFLCTYRTDLPRGGRHSPLVQSHQDLKQSIKTKNVPLLEGTIRLDARLSSDWIGDLSRAGFPSFSGISDLECLNDLFGELTLRDAHFAHKTDLQSLTCKFSTLDNKYVKFISNDIILYRVE